MQQANLAPAFRGVLGTQSTVLWHPATGRRPAEHPQAQAPPVRVEDQMETQPRRHVVADGSAFSKRNSPDAEENRVGMRRSLRRNTPAQKGSQQAIRRLWMTLPLHHPRLPAANLLRRELPQMRQHTQSPHSLGDAVSRTDANRLRPVYTGRKLLRLGGCVN